MTDKLSQATLHWLAALIPEAPSVELLLKLSEEHVPAKIRSLAAIRLLETNHRTQAIAVLQELFVKTPEHAPLIAKALVRIHETNLLDLQLLREAAFLSDDDGAEQATVILFDMGDDQCALAASLYRLARPGKMRDKQIWTLVERLLSQEHTDVGVSAATWLALKPGYRYRLQACEALLESGNVEEAILLLQFLAYECHDDTSLQACQRLLMLKEADRVVPLLTIVAQRSTPDICYQARLALALSAQPQVRDETPQVTRHRLKESIWRERTDSYRAALSTFCETGIAALAAGSGSDEQTRHMQALAYARLHILADPTHVYDPSDHLLNSSWSAIRVATAPLVVETGSVVDVQTRLTELLREPKSSCSVLVRREVVRRLRQIIDSGMIDVFIQILGDQDQEVRRGAAEALGILGHPAALEPLIHALHDEDDDVRRGAALALGTLGHPAALEPLMHILSHEDVHVRWGAAQALGTLGHPAALEPLTRALADENVQVRLGVTQALGQIDDLNVVPPLHRVILEQAGGEQEAVRSLAKLKSHQSLSLLIAMSFGVSEYRAATHATALVQLAPEASLSVLAWYAQRFPKESWPRRLQGLAQWRMGNIEVALGHLEVALEHEENITNLLTVAHFYLEHDDLATAKAFVDRAARKDRRNALILVSQAVILWQDNAAAEALQKLRQAKQRGRQVINLKDLAFDHFWGPRALASLEAMMAV